MQNLQDIFETPKRSMISTFSICMTVPLNIDLWGFGHFGQSPVIKILSQLAFACSKSTMETLEQCAKSVQSQLYRHHNDVSVVSLVFFIVNFEQISNSFGISIVDFKQTNAGWGIWLNENGTEREAVITRNFTSNFFTARFVRK